MRPVESTESPVGPESRSCAPSTPGGARRRRRSRSSGARRRCSSRTRRARCRRGLQGPGARRCSRSRRRRRRSRCRRSDRSACRRGRLRHPGRRRRPCAGRRGSGVASAGADDARQRERACGRMDRDHSTRPAVVGRIGRCTGCTRTVREDAAAEDRHERLPGHVDGPGEAAGRVPGRGAWGRAQLGREHAVAGQVDLTTLPAWDSRRHAVPAVRLDLVDRERPRRG